MTLEQIFGTTAQVTWSQEIARALLVFLYGLVLVRLAGRRVFGKWSALDIIVSVIIGSNLSRALTGSAPLWGTLAASTAIMVVHWLLAQAVARSSALSRMIEGRGKSIASNGKIDERQRTWMSVSEADLAEALRRDGVASRDQIGDVVVEPSGRLTVIKR